MRNPNAWLVLAMLAVAASLHYGCHIKLIAMLSGGCPPGLTRHAMDRVVLLLPITYAGFVFGPAVGFVTLVLAALIMLPRAILISPVPSDAILETVAVLVVGTLVILWFDSLEREKRRRAEAVAKLEAAHQELQSYVQIIEKNERQLSALNTVSAILSQSLELEQVLNSALEKVLETLKLEAEGGIFLLDEETQELVLSVHQGLSPEFARREERIASGECLCGLVAQSGELLFSDDCRNDIRHTRQSRVGSHSHIIVPLKSKERVLGVMFLYPHASYHASTEDLQLLTAIGSQIGVAIDNASLYKKERAIAEQLRVSEQNYRQLFENANDAIWVQDMDGRIVAMNEASARLTGYSQEELIGSNVGDFLTQGGLEIARDVKRHLLQGEGFEQPYEQQLITKNGTARVIKLTSSLVTRDGHSTGFQHIARDITEEKKLQQDLRFYAQQITQAQEEERKRIARELHDDTAQALVTLSRQLDSLTDGTEMLPQHAVERLEEVRSQIDSVLEGVRRFSHDLRPSMLDDLGLVPALESIADDVTSQHGIITAVKVLGERRHLSSEKELLLFRVGQEALRNVWRHSKASRAWITLEFGPERIRIVVEDNGVGFQVPDRVGDLLAAGKLGLAGMHERAQLLGGSMMVESELGKRTAVTVVVPAQGKR